MTTRWEQLQAAFEAARGLPRERRRDELRRRLGSDSAAISRVESMLEVDATEHSPLDHPPHALAQELLEGSAPAPSQIGAYRIVGTLGRGGMGVVYRGARADLDRTDAIKLLHGTLLSPLRRELFEREQRLLSSLTHPSIARIYDAGALDDGTPYFVMEQVDGLPLDQAAERHALDGAARVRLFLQICDAVQYAHARGVIHRDLKPSNVWITDDAAAPRVKLLDFGIAQRPGSDADPIAAFTPDYAAPEQVAGEAATVLSDVYSLGVLLRQLLARQPPRGSTPASTAATRVGGLSTLAWRELDSICAKAAHLDPSRRYPTVDALAEELRRQMSDRPVDAVGASFPYALRKLIRRHRIGVGATALIALLLFGSATVVFVQSRRAVAERDRAERERISAEQLSDFLIGLFQASDPASVRGQELLARELLDRAAAGMPSTDDLAAEDQARFLHAIAVAYDHLGLYEEQASTLRAALRVPAVDARQTPPTATILRAELAGALLQLGDFDATEALLDEAQSVIEARGASIAATDRLAIESKRAYLRWLQGDLAAAEQIFLEVIPALESAQQSNPDPKARALLEQRSLESLANLAAVYSTQARFDEAGRLYRRAIEALTRRIGADHPSTLLQRGNLASMELRRRNYVRARELLVPLLADKRRVLGDGHADTLRSVNGLAVAEHYLGNLDEAEALFIEALEHSRSSLPQGHRETLGLMANLASVQMELGKHDAARGLHQEVYQGFRQALGPGHQVTGLVLHNLAGANVQVGRLREADRQYRDAQEILAAALPPGHPNLALNLEAWSALKRQLGEAARADALADQATTVRKAAPTG